jgi:hypothetical protein
MDGEGTVWVANGDQINQDGTLLRVDRQGHQSVALDRRGPGSGCMVDVLQTADPNKLVLIRDNLPVLDHSSVELFDKTTGKCEILLSAKPGDSRFFSLGDIQGDSLWVVEVLGAQIHCIDLGSGKKRALDISAFLGPVRGIRSSFTVIESVSVVPLTLKLRCEMPTIWQRGYEEDTKLDKDERVPFK